MTNVPAVSPADPNNPEELDLTGVHQNVRQSIELDFAHPTFASKRAILAFLGKHPDRVFEDKEIHQQIGGKLDTVQKNLRALNILSLQNANKYGWKIDKIEETIHNGKNPEHKVKYKLTVDKKDASPRTHPLSEIITEERETPITNEMLTEASKTIRGLTVTSSPTDKDQEFSAKAKDLGLTPKAFAYLLELRQAGINHNAVSLKHLRAELDIPSKGPDNPDYNLQQKINKSVVKNGFIMLSVAPGYHALLYVSPDGLELLRETTLLREKLDALVPFVAHLERSRTALGVRADTLAQRVITLSNKTRTNEAHEILVGVIMDLRDELDALCERQFEVGKRGFSALYEKRRRIEGNVRELEQKDEVLRSRARLLEEKLAKMKEEEGARETLGEVNQQIARARRELDDLRLKTSRKQRHLGKWDAE